LNVNALFPFKDGENNSEVLHCIFFSCF